MKITFPQKAFYRIVFPILIANILCFSFFTLLSADTIVGGPITQNTTWTLSGSPYVVTSDVTVQGPSSNIPVLTIEPGVIVKFNLNTSLGLGNGPNLKGILVAQGTPENPITFTSNAPTPAAGNWYGIGMGNTTSSTILEHCIIKYAGKRYWWNNLGSAIGCDSASPQIKNCTIEYSDCYGISTGIYTTPIINNNVISHCNYYPLKVEAASFPQLSGNAYLDNNPNMVQINRGTISTNTTIPNEGIPYTITGEGNYIYVNAPSPNVPILTILPGVEMRFNEGGALGIGSGPLNKGILMAQGTPENPIKFTSNATSPQPGDWAGISIDNTLAYTILEHCTVEYAGNGIYIGTYGSLSKINNNIIQYNSGTGLYAIDPSPIPLANNTFDNNNSYPLHIPLSWVQQLNGNTYLNNGINAIEVVGGNIDSNFIWPHDGVPYVITNYIYLGFSIQPAPPILVIEPGVELRFNSSGALGVGNGPYASGILKAEGTAAQPIRFTSTNPNPQPGAWAGISLDHTTSDTILDHGIVEYGNTNISCGPYDSSFTLSNSTIKNGNYGINIANAASIANIKIQNNNFLDNINYGLYNLNPNKVNALINYWGDASGPSGSGSGTGDPINENVSYQPWLTQTVTQPFHFANASVSQSSFNPNGGITIISATLPELSNWTISIQDSGSQTVKTFVGTGSGINQNWDGTDNSGLVLPDGNYTYLIQATSTITGQAASPAKGTVTLDQTKPIANITSPEPYSLIQGTVSIIGTATGTEPMSYVVDYGIGENPVSWTTLNSSASPVINGQLAAWNVFGLSGAYTIRLTVTDSQNDTAETKIVIYIDNIQITNVSVNPTPFNPLNGETVVISYALDRDAEVTIEIEDLEYSLIKAIGPNNKLAGLNSDMWDGRDQLGQLVGDGAYTFNIAASNQLVTGEFIPDYFYTTVDISNFGINSNVDPYDNELCPINYDLADTALVYIGGGIPDHGDNWAIVGWKARPAGTNTDYWDGRDNNGTITNLDEVMIACWADTLPDLPLIVSGTQFLIDISIDPYVVTPSYADIVEISYTVLQTANVTVSVFDFNNNLVKILIDNQSQSAGTYSVNWDGTDTEGKIVSASGNYKVKVEIAPSGAQSSIRWGNITIF